MYEHIQVDDMDFPCSEYEPIGNVGCLKRPHFVWTCVDRRSIDMYEDFILFYNRKDAEDMRDSFGSDSIHFDVHSVEIV